MPAVIDRDSAIRQLALEEAGWGSATRAEPFTSLCSDDDGFHPGVDAARITPDGFHVAYTPYWTSRVHEAAVSGEYAQLIEQVLVDVFRPTTDPALRALQEDKLEAVASYITEVCGRLEGVELARTMKAISAGIVLAAANYGEAIVKARTLRRALRPQLQRVRDWEKQTVTALIAEAFGDDLRSQLVEVLRTATPQAAKTSHRRGRGRRHYRGRRPARRS